MIFLVWLLWSARTIDWQFLLKSLHVLKVSMLVWNVFEEGDEYRPLVLVDQKLRSDLDQRLSQLSVTSRHVASDPHISAFCLDV